MKKNKIITFILAAMMMASLAIPASAADVNNQTTVNFTYNSTKTIDEDNKDKVYKITIPSSIDMEGKEGDKGATFEGTGTVTLSGMIGQDDHVDISVASTNGYVLKGDGATTVNYKMDLTSTSEGITVQTGTFNTACGTDSKAFAKGTAVAFQKDGTITMNFANDGDTGVYGKCALNDTLTFTYAYNDVDADEEGLSNTFSTQAQ